MNIARNGSRPAEGLFSMDLDQPSRDNRTSPLEDRLTVGNENSHALTSVSCEDIMPQSSKVVVLDSKISVLCAFEAMIDNNVEAATVWSCTERDYIAVITPTDFLELVVKFIHDVLKTHPNCSTAFETLFLEFAQLPIQEELTKGKRKNNLLDPQDTLQDAVELLITDESGNFVPVIYQESTHTEAVVLYMLSSRRLLSFMTRILPERVFAQNVEVPIDSLRTFVSPDTPLLEVLDINFYDEELEHGRKARNKGNGLVPIIERESGKLIHVFDSAVVVPKSHNYQVNKYDEVSRVPNNSHWRGKSGRKRLVEFATFVFNNRDQPIRELLKSGVSIYDELPSEGDSPSNLRKKTIDSETTFGQVIQRMTENHRISLVCLEGGTPVGMVDLKELLKQLVHSP
eukprot:TRINITY_DN5227_c0_g1_i17.p1 TRINITY_DN5227_c0_g1~~TRINITY_DN5227_c0_g1_i17.p1  ORF type:complete len:400 (-),score=63.18 TRINITY_DN5227_c0_g1_i17:513-1712(-)